LSPFPLSVILCTYNRAGFLEKSLEGLARQTVSKKDFEVIIVDDGSQDNTTAVVEAFNGILPIQYLYQENKGLAFAKNRGIEKAQGDILVFLDDDDQASPSFLEEHLKTHRAFPEKNYSVLNFTTWSPHLKITPLMEFIITASGGLFSYSALKHGQILNYLFFWGGRSSCKREFLLENGLFNPIFRFGNEDAELGYRLSKLGFKVIYNKNAVSYMMRPIGFEDFCRRSILQGRANFIWSRLHPEPEVLEWCQMDTINQNWSTVRENFDLIIEYARELDDFGNKIMNLGVPLPFPFRDILKMAYGEAFWACKIKGIMEERREQASSVESSPQKTFLLDPIQAPFKVVAIICAYNEGDIIYHVIRHLIENDIYVYLLNHHSTDNTLEEASKWLGKGLLHIELFPDESDMPKKHEEIFALRMITKRIEQLHLELGADWYLHHDADEFRESPWPRMTLCDSIKLVDALGYNAIDFNLLNFRPIDNSFIPGEDVRQFLKYYEPGEDFNKIQIKAWKNFGQSIDLCTFFGHEPIFEGKKVFPCRFLTLHFPVRSSEHGLKKAIKERIKRFDPKEREAGAHIQYDEINKEYNFIRKKKELTLYQATKVREKLWFDVIFKEVGNREEGDLRS